jgi:hypothetical protein
MLQTSPFVLATIFHLPLNNSKNIGTEQWSAHGGTTSHANHYVVIGSPTLGYQESLAWLLAPSNHAKHFGVTESPQLGTRKAWRDCWVPSSHAKHSSVNGSPLIYTNFWHDCCINLISFGVLWYQQTYFHSCAMWIPPALLGGVTP